MEEGRMENGVESGGLKMALRVEKSKIRFSLYLSIPFLPSSPSSLSSLPPFSPFLLIYKGVT